MTTHYRGQRITDLLKQIDELKLVLDANQDTEDAHDKLKVLLAYGDLAIAKAKLTALQGEE